jgi:hypothetical protein
MAICLVASLSGTNRNVHFTSENLKIMLKVSPHCPLFKFCLNPALEITYHHVHWKKAETFVSYKILLCLPTLQRPSSVVTINSFGSKGGKKIHKATTLLNMTEWRPMRNAKNSSYRHAGSLNIENILSWDKGGQHSGEKHHRFKVILNSLRRDRLHQSTKQQQKPSNCTLHCNLSHQIISYPTILQ